MKTLLVIGLAGLFGTMARYLISMWVDKSIPLNFPFGTLTVNVVGSFVMGIIMALSLKYFLISETWRLILGVGFLGALTTYSTFSFETLLLMHTQEWSKVAANILLNAFGTLLAVMAGWALVCKIKNPI